MLDCSIPKNFLLPEKILNQTKCRIKKNCRQRFALEGTCGRKRLFCAEARVGCGTQRYPLSAAQCHVQRIFTAPKFPSQDVLSYVQFFPKNARFSSQLKFFRQDRRSFVRLRSHDFLNGVFLRIFLLYVLISL